MEVRASRGRTVKIRTGPEFLAQDSSSGGLNNLSQNGDSLPSIRDSLLSICIKEPLSTAPGKSPHLASILNIISKQLEKTGPHELDVDLAALFSCLRIILVNESKSVRAAGLRVIRLCLVDQNTVQVLLDTHLHHFIAKCYDVLVDNAAERTQALRLCRRLVLLNPQLFPLSLGRAVVALASDGGKEKDRMVRASLALLAELCILNPNAFINSGGIRCFSSAILDCSSPRMQEAMVACFLYLLDAQERRSASGLSLRFLVAPYSDYHYKHYIDTTGQGGVDVGQHPNPNAQVIEAPGTDRELRLLCAKQALLTVLRSWSGLLHLVSTRILDDLVRVLLPCHLETRKSMLEFFYTLLRLPLPEWTDEFEVALEATDPSRVHESWRLSDGFVAAEGKALLPHVSKSRPNLVANHTALLVYCLLEAQLLPTLVEVIVSSDTFISVRATILLGELLHLTSTLLPPACHGTKACLPRLVDYATSAIGPSAGLHHQDQSLRRHRAAQASSALTKIHHMKKRGIQLRSLALRQVVELEHRAGHRHNGSDRLLREKKTEEPSALAVSSSDSVGMCSSNGEVDLEMRSSRDPDGVLYTLARDCGVLAGGQRDPLLWNWPVLSDLLDWCLLNSLTMEESSCVRSIVRRLIQFYKPSSNQFCQCESGSPLSSSSTPTHSGKGCSRTRLYTTVGCHLMDFLTVVNEPESEKILAEFLDDLSSTVRDITLVSSAHDCMLSPGRLSTTACADYFLLMGRLSASTNGINALERAGIFQDLLELVASTHHDCYLKLIVSTLDYHTDGYARAILKKVLVGTVESGRIYATHQLRILVRAAAEAGTMTSLAKWAVPLLLCQLKDKCRAVVVAAADILDEATDDSAFIEALIPLYSQLADLIRQQESLHLDSRGTLLLVKLLSLPAGFKLWSEQEEDQQNGKGKISLVQLELEKWINRLNIRYVQLLESDLADGLTQHQRADDGRYGRLSNIRHGIRDLPIPPHLFSQLNRHREGLDFLRTSGQLSTIFSVITNSTAMVETNESIVELKAAIWASAHLGTSEAGVALLESAQVVEALVRLASNSQVLALRGTAFFALNLIAVTPAGVNFLSRLGWASIKRHHGELWHVVDDSEWNCLLTDHPETLRFPTLVDGSLCVDGLSVRDRTQSSLHTDFGATGSNHQQARFRTVSQSSGHSVTFASDDAHADRDGEGDETIPAGTLTSTPRRTAPKSGDGQGNSSCWETDSQPYSLEGSSIHFDSDSDQSSIVNNTDSADQRTCRRAYTLPPPSSQTTSGRGEVSVHARSFSDSHYSPANGEDDVVTNPICTLNSASGGGKRSGSGSGKTRIWTKLRTSLRFRRSKRFSLPPRSSNIVTPSTPPPGVSPTLSRPVETGPAIVLADFSSPLSSSACVTGESLNSGTEESLDKDEEDDEEDSSPPLLIQVNRIGSIHNHLNRMKSVQYKKRRSVSGSSGSSRSHRSSGFNCYIGLCLPVQLSHLHPPPSWFDPPPPPSQPADTSSDCTLSYPIPESLPLGEDSQCHQKEVCIICSSSTSVAVNDDTISSTSTPSEEEKLLVRKELLRLVGNMGSSVGLNANEQGLLRLKQRFPWAFHSVCLFSDVCSALTAYGYRLRARRFLHELFMDSPFNELYTAALARLTTPSIGINRIQEVEESNVQPSTSSNP